jgi:DNA helicase-2/ATP-dependent DNA helicase PcrA
MSDTPDILAGLNEAQRSAVTAPFGPTLILAGPGSGKTTVLTRRIAYLIVEHHVPPWKVLAVTFTNKAAKAMAQRIDELVPKPLEEEKRGRVRMGTFHAICAGMLRREADHLPITADYVIYDTDDQRALMKEVITADLKLDDKLYRPDSILNRVSQAKNDLFTPEAFHPTTYREEVVKRAYESYQRRLVLNNAVDFDDLLLMAVRLFEDQPAVLARYQQTYDHVLVDEFQDTNTAQYRLVKLLASPRDNLFCVGDEDQSIYRWRGADFRNVLRLREDYPQLNVILLEQNYRSTQTILDASVAVIDKNTQRTRKALFTEQSAGPDIVVFEANNETYEAQFVVDTIAGLVAQNEVEPGEVAVMYRMNSQSRVLEDSFVRANLPYRLVGATRFYSRKEIKDLLAYLRVIHNPDDGISLLRVINVPPRGIGDKTLDTLAAWAAQLNVSSYGALQTLADGSMAGPFGGRARNALTDFAIKLNAWRAMKDGAPIGDVLRRVIEDTGYEPYVHDSTEEGEDRWANVLELINVAAEFEETPLATFLEEVALVSDIDTLPEGVNAPTLLTLHAAKGLEFDAVFIVGLEENLLPHSRSMSDPEEMAEERRLMYVGMTRARKRLYLLHAFQRTQWGQSEINPPSRFLDDIPKELTLASARVGGLGTAYRQSTSWSGPPKISPEKVARPVGQFKAGQKVFHAKFGSGLVIDSRISGDDEEVSVVFDNAGVKRLMAGFAKLKVVE